MTPAAQVPAMHQETFDFFLFRLGPFLLGAVVTQVTGIRHKDISKIESDVELVDLRGIFHLTPKEEAALSPTFLEVGGERGRTYVPVDAVEGIISLSLSQIRKLPPLIESHKSHPSLWGLALLDKEIIFLMDLDQVKTE
jgi:chemotaxis signal transduction protein